MFFLSRPSVFRFSLRDTVHFSGLFAGLFAVVAVAFLVFTPAATFAAGLGPVPTVSDSASDSDGESNSDSQVPLPKIYLSDIFLQPQVRVYEPSQGGLDPVLWSAGIRTRFSSWVDAKLSFGAKELQYRPSWAPAASGDVQIIEAKATLHSLIGDFFAGQVMVPWGLEGQTPERLLWLPRDLLIEQGALPLFDIGVGFHTESEGFYMNVLAHNGEGAGSPNLDNRMLVTGQWGYLGPANTNLGLSLIAGRMAPPDVAIESRLRGVNAFFGFNIYGLGLQLEGSYIDSSNDTVTSAVTSWHADLEHPITSHVNLVGRYEQYNPNSKVTSNVLGRGILGGEVHSADNSSQLFLYLIKNNESLVEVPNDEIRLVWRISPPLE